MHLPMNIDLHGFGPAMMAGTLMTVKLALCALLLGLVLGLLGALAKTSPVKPLQWLGSTYSTLVRGVPELLWVLLIYFGTVGLMNSLGEALNMPGLELGKLHFRDGAMMAAVDNWEIELIGKGSHGSMPELSIDPVVAGSSLVLALQTIVSRNVSPHNSAVVTVGAFISGNAGNVIAQSAILRLAIRTTTPDDRKLVLGRYGRLQRHKRRLSAAPTRSGKACRGQSL